MKRTIRYLIITALIAIMPAYAWGADLKAKVNIVLDDGTIMMYSGKKAGVGVGDSFEVFRAGKSVGHIQIKESQDFVSYAKLVDGDVKEMDEAVRTAAGKPAKAAKPEKTEDSESAPAKKDTAKKPPRSSKKKATEETAKEDSGSDEEGSVKEETTEESAPKEKKTGSSRREQAAKKGSEKKTDESAEETKTESKPAEKEEKQAGKKGSDKKEDKKADKKDSGKKPAPTFVKAPESNWLAPLGGLGPTGYGLTGGIYVPSANVLRRGQGSVHFSYVDAAQEKRLLYKDTGYGITYGLGNDIEVAYTYLKTTYDTPMSSGNISADDSSNIFSFKFQTKYTRAPSFLTSNITETRLAFGINYFSINQNLQTTALTYNYQSTATRLFAVMTGKYSSGVGHLGVYYQKGDILDNTDYDGIGYFAGAEYFLGGSRGDSKNSYTNKLAVIAEYDSDAFYLGTLKTPSIGLRYYFNEASHVTASMLDVTDASVLNFEGAYGF